jgi:N-acetylglucosaminyl-diphospho-decaprenol L-rhamnosyltransferase
MMHSPTPTLDSVVSAGPRASAAHIRRDLPAPATQIDISVCIANWNCRDFLRGCLESLREFAQGVRLEIIVCDNASTDGAAEMVEREFPEVILIRNRENLGFARASNQAAEPATGRYVFFLNNDTIVPPGTLRELLDFAESHPEAGMIGPLLRDSDGKPQISYRQRPTIGAMLHRTALLRWTGLLKRSYYRYRRSSFVAQGTREVEVLMGAAVLIRRDIFESCGRWDEDFRFGGEDIELSTRIGRTRSLIYVPHIEITHFGRISSRLNVAFSAPNVAIGYVRYFRKSGASAAAIRFYQLVVTLETPVHLATKMVQVGWRRLRGQSDRAEKSRIVMLGLWRFLSRDLLRFWRT